MPFAFYALQKDLDAVARIEALPDLLKMTSEISGLGFVVVARLTETAFTACAVHDTIECGMQVPTTVASRTTLSLDVRRHRKPIVIDHASTDPRYLESLAPRLYRYESYVSVPIILANGDYFGNLCALDREPQAVCVPRLVLLFQCCARLIAEQIDLASSSDHERAALLDKTVVKNLGSFFVALLAHDLYAPAAGPFAAHNCRATPTWDTSVAIVAEKIDKATALLPDVIDEVLGVARRPVFGGMGVELQRIDDLEAALRSIVADATADFPHRTIIANIKVDRAVQGDRTRLQQMLGGLLRDVLVYGAKSGAISIVVTTTEDELRIAVWNTGTVLSKTKLAGLFRARWRPKPDGSGLCIALHLCSEIARAHGGILEASSAPRNGTRFVATLPVVPPARLH